jgi:hypothetical protein
MLPAIPAPVQAGWLAVTLCFLRHMPALTLPALPPRACPALQEARPAR